MSSPMSTVSRPEVDPQTLQDLRLIESTRRMFSACGERVDAWEAFTLVKSAREEVQAEADRVQGWVQTGMRAMLCPSLKERLTSLRAEFGALATKLTGYLHASGTSSLDPSMVDLAVVFLMGSSKARESASRWVSDPAGSAAEASLKLRILSGLVQSCLAALETAPTKAEAGDTALRRPGSASIRLKPDVIEALRTVVRSRALLQESGLGMLGWEIYYLTLTRADETRLTVEELAPLRTGGKPGEFAGVAYRLRSQLKEVRAVHESLISQLRAYLTGAFGSFDSDRDELAIALLAGAPQGPHLARQWLDDPGLCHDAAVASMTAMRARASAYLESARKPASGSEPQRVA
jgi:hypothetical protein